MSEPKVTNKRTTILLVALLSGLALVADGQGWVRLGPEPSPAPAPAPSPDPAPTPTPVPTPTPTPEPKPPAPTPTDEVFPTVPADLQAVSAPIKTFLTSADDALIYARAYKAFAKEVARDDTVTSNKRFRDLHIAVLKSLIKESPGMELRNPGLGKAIDAVIAAAQITPANPDGLTPETWTAEQRQRCAKAFEAVSGQAYAAYLSLIKPTSRIDFTGDTLVCFGRTTTTLATQPTCGLQRRLIGTPSAIPTCLNCTTFPSYPPTIVPDGPPWKSSDQYANFCDSPSPFQFCIG